MAAAMATTSVPARAKVRGMFSGITEDLGS
jgi:hypothetical protein